MTNRKAYNNHKKYYWLSSPGVWMREAQDMKSCGVTKEEFEELKKEENAEFADRFILMGASIYKKQAVACGMSLLDYARIVHEPITF